MPGNISGFKWGTGEENLLLFDYPFDNVRYYRKRRPASSRIRIPGGGYDPWDAGKDFMVETDVRWLSMAKWSDPVGVQAFLDYAGDGGTFSFLPDATVPDFSVPNCFLESPYESPNPGSEQSGEQIVRIIFGNPTVNLSQAMRGIMFEYVPGMSLTDPVAASFTRTTAATRRGLPGNLTAAIGATDAAGVLRDRHYEGSLRTTLLEAARTQLVPDPENFGNWAINEGTPGRTGGQPDPFGGTAAYLLEDNDSGSQESISQVVTYTGNGTKCVLILMRAGTTAANFIGLRDVTASAWRHLVVVTWTGGVPSLSTNTGGGTLFPVESFGGGWYLLSFSATGVIAANDNRIIIYAGTVSSDTGTVYIFRANSWNAAFPSSSQGPSLGTKNGDLLTWSWAYRPQPQFLLVDFIERGSGQQTDSPRLVQISNAVDGTPQAVLYVPTGGGAYRMYHNNGATAVFVALASATYGARVQLLGLIYPDGATRLKKAVNGGAESDSGLSSANPLAAVWSGPTLIVPNSLPNGTLAGHIAVASIKTGPLTFAGITRDTIAKALAA
jgi:hypothetical protein